MLMDTRTILLNYITGVMQVSVIKGLLLLACNRLGNAPDNNRKCEDGIRWNFNNTLENADFAGDITLIFNIYKII